MKFNYGKIFLLGFGFFGVSVIWGVYNAFVPIFLANKFHLTPAFIGFFMTLDNIAALFIQPPVGAWSDRLRTPIGRRIPFILVGAPITALAFGFIPIASVLPLFVACTSTLLLSAALWRTPVVALMPDITPSDKRSQANGIINFMGGIGTIIALQTGGMLYKLSPTFPFWLGSALVLLAAFFVLFAIPSGFIAARIGRRVTISFGLIIVSVVLALFYVISAKTLLTPISPLPLVGIPLTEGGPRMLTMAGVMLIFGGIGWAFVNINSLPMVVELTTAARLGTFTGLYYLFSTLSAIVGPNVNGWAIQLTGNNYNVIMLVAPFFMLTAFVLMLGVRRGEATTS